MKIVISILGTLTFVFVIVQLFALKTQKDIETYPYVVVKKYDQFEIRKYESRLFTSVTLPTNQYKNASGNGFSILAGYIFGNNKTNEKIAMTSPVAMSLEDSMTMMFMVPEKNKESLPEPNSKQIKFQEEPAKTVAAITFGGWADQEKINRYKSELIEALESNKISYTQKFYFLGYNAPYETYNRRNEVIVELDNP
ncbi:MAG: heme-binding protein [Bacteroidia bacterium]|nr:heme-binding protein [Bacteroidia bacterium]|tara:strand:+ start:441 stop:1028 length:588 start_codon:yes stop_codon:yes gene_type:complete